MSNTNSLFTSSGVPVDAGTGLAFGFVEADIVEQLSENN
jgi:hypothetical protein